MNRLEEGDDYGLIVQEIAFNLNDALHYDYALE